VRFAPDVVRWVRERQHFAYAGEEETPEGVVMLYRVRELRSILPWLLSWGASAEVLLPAELRAQIRQEAARLAEMLT